MTDQQRHDWVGSAGQQIYTTPNLDRLAAAGTTFERAYSGAATCVPARNGLLTGLQQHRLPLVPGTEQLVPGTWTVARGLRDVGYETALIGRMHFHPLDADHGFEVVRSCEVVTGLSGYADDELDDYARWVVPRLGHDPRRLAPDRHGELRPLLAGSVRTFAHDAELHPAAWVAREAERFLAERTDDRPLFLVVSFNHPHGPYDPPEPHASLVDPDDVALPQEGFAVNDALGQPWLDELERGRRFRVDVAGERFVRRILAAVAGLVRLVDDGLGTVLDAVDLDRTVVAFTSDHGDFGGHRGLYNKVPWIPFEDLLRVPLVVGGAGATPGTRCPLPVQTTDLPATWLDWAGAAAPVDGDDARSLRPLVEGRPDPGADERTLVAAVGGWGYATAIRGGHKLITRGLHERLLFDLDEDPGEVRPVQDDPGHRAVGEELAALLGERWAEGPAPLPGTPALGGPTAP